MKVSSVVLKNGNVKFENFVVIKESDTFYGVYEEYQTRQCKYNEDSLITSGKTLQQACKKAKLLQIGYNLAKIDLKDWDHYVWNA